MASAVDLCRKCILNLTPYVPGKPIEEVKRELGLDDVVKLASNENPLGPSPMALPRRSPAGAPRAIAALEVLHRIRSVREIDRLRGVGAGDGRVRLEQAGFVVLEQARRDAVRSQGFDSLEIL
jgi:hypothetical protein